MEREVVEGELVPAGMSSEAGKILEQGGALVRLENQTQMQVAVQRPRKEAEILKDALQGLDIYPELADKALYSKPVGDGKFATGLSVRAAEDLANRWTNSSFGAEIISDDGEVVTGCSVFVDYEKNQRRAFPFRVARKYKGKDGIIKRHAEDRFNDIVVKAALSKSLRECLLRSLPAGLKAEYEKKVRTVIHANMSGKKGDAVGRMIAAFARFGVSKEEIEKLRGKDLAAFDAEDVTEMGAIFNSIEDGDTTVNQTFNREQAAPVETEAERKARAKAAIEELKGMGPAPAQAPAPEPAPAKPANGSAGTIRRTKAQAKAEPAPTPEPPPSREPGDEPPEPAQAELVDWYERLAGEEQRLQLTDLQRAAICRLRVAADDPNHLSAANAQTVAELMTNFKDGAAAENWIKAIERKRKNE